MRNPLMEMFSLPLRMAQLGIDQMQRWTPPGGSQNVRPSNVMQPPRWNPPHVTDRGNSQVPASPATPASPAAQRTPVAAPGQLGSLDASQMVVLGSGLAAGLHGQTLDARFQAQSFAAQLARHLGSKQFSIPSIQPPGLSSSALSSTSLPSSGQTTILENFPPPTAFSNSSVPGFTVADALRRRPSSPLLQRHDARQTAANLLIDPRGLMEGESDNPTLLESALSQVPTLIVIALGFDDMLEFIQQATTDHASSETKRCFRCDYDQMLNEVIASGASVIVVNPFSPLDTARYSTLDSASKVLNTSASTLGDLYQLHEHDRITVEGLYEIGFQISSRSITSLDERHVLSHEQAAIASDFSSWLRDEISQLGQQHNLPVVDLEPVARQLQGSGIRVGNRTITGDYLGGFYSVDGHSPGMVGQTLIANHLIGALNTAFQATIPTLNPAEFLSADPVANYRPAVGRSWSRDELRSFVTTPPSASDLEPARPSSSSSNVSRGRTQSDRFRSMEERYNFVYRDQPAEPLRLPANRELTLELHSESSYFGDAIAAVNCSPDNPHRATGCSSTLFGGLVMTSSQLTGVIKIRFEPPIAGVTRFTVELGNGLAATEGVLSAPELLKLPTLQGGVQVFPGQLCTGELNLQTGEVTQPQFNFLFGNSALEALVKVNPNFPKVPVSFPGQYGTAVVRFLQRDDDQLDFVFSGTTFAPLGAEGRFPLPFESADGAVANIPAAGSALHPHIHLSTMDLGVAETLPQELELPENSLAEFTTAVSKTSFGDDFRLNNPELGFTRGRSQLTGRTLVQFGKRSGDHLPFAVTLVPPGGSMYSQDLSFIQNLFPGQVNQGLIGHDSVLRFPMRDYRTNDMYVVNDPFDIPWGVVNLKTGEVSGDFLHRSFFGQNVFFALLRVEPRTPKGSFEYRGPAMFEQERDQWRLRFNGTCYLPYQEGFLFPKPNLADGFVIGSNSALDPFFQIDSVCSQQPRTGRKNGVATKQIASTGDVFSYRYSISNTTGNPRASFEYTNHSQGGTFVMDSLTWVEFFNSGTQRSSDLDTVAFNGFGRWSLDESDRLHSVSAQFSTERGNPYSSILIDGGQVSNVNTQLKHTPPPLTAI